MIEKLLLKDASTTWKQFESSCIFSQYEWHKTWFETEGHEYEPYILLVNNTVLAPFARKDDDIIFSAQRFSDYSDILGSDENKLFAWNEILEYLKQDGVKTVHLKNISHKSTTISFFQSLFPLSITQQDTTPVLFLPDTFDEYISSLPRRSEIKRKLKRFEEENPHAVIRKSTDCEKDLPHLITLMKHHPEKQTYLTKPVEDFFLRLGTLPHISLLFLQVNNEYVAGRLFFEDEKTIYGYNSGYISGKYSGSGYYLLLQLIRQAITNKKKIYNFLRGSESYKYELGAKDFAICEVKVRL